MTEIGYHPLRLDLTVHVGDPVDVGVPVLDATGTAVSLAGWTVAAYALAPGGGAVLHDFAPTIVSDVIQVAATSAQTAAWAWPDYAARFEVTATPPEGGPLSITLGWIRLYRA